MKRAGLLFILATGVLLLFLLDRKMGPAIEAPCDCPLSPTTSELGPKEEPKVNVLRETAFDLRFGQPATDPREDLELLHEILSQSRLLIKDHARFPLADNADFVRFLSGGNPHRVAWIRPRHPSVNPAGELTDRWGTPVFFHQESSSRTSLRSAGPDRVFWNGDDLVREDPDDDGRE